jgi:two-component system, cell cycle sensor histidine kinase and response regulator CckA
MSHHSTPRPGAAPFPSPTLAEDILNALETMVSVVNGKGEIVYANPAVERVLGFRIDQVLGEGWWGLVYKRYPALGHQIRERLSATARGEIVVETQPHAAPACDVLGHEHTILWKDAKGPGDLVIGVGQDVTALHQAEHLVACREREFRAVFDNASDGIMILNKDWLYEQANVAACRILGLQPTEIIGKMNGRVREANIDFSMLQSRALRDGVVHEEVEFDLPDGDRRHVELSIATNFRPDHHLVIIRDINESRRLQAQVAQAQQLEAIGKLAGGVAHDFNNMLTAIRGYTELLQKKMGEGPLRRYADAIMGASLRASDTTHQLLAFSRKQMLQPRLLDLNHAVLDTLGLLRRVIGEDVELVTLLSPDAGTVMIDPGQFSQVLMNLAINSRDAMPGGGTLIIESRRIDLDDEYVLRHIQVAPGEYSMLAVTDTGTGMPAQIISHIFEPFFTTKEQGKGTGLGLATVYGIVKQSSGYVWVYSEPGQGTTFKIYLPYVNPERELQIRLEANKKAILVIEDDEVIRTIIATALEEMGFRALQAADGSQALKLCQACNAPLDLVLTDVNAEGLSGEDLMGYFAIKYAKTPVIHMSGFSRSRLEAAGTLAKEALFLGKPFTVEQLQEIVRQALETN